MWAKVSVETKTVNIKKLQVATKENHNKQIHVTTKKTRTVTNTYIISARENCCKLDSE